MAAETTGLEWETTAVESKYNGRPIKIEKTWDLRSEATTYHWNILGVKGGFAPTLEAAKAAVERIVTQDLPGGAG